MLPIESVVSPAVPALASWANGRLLVAAESGGAWLDARLLTEAQSHAIALAPSGDHALLLRKDDRSAVLWSRGEAPVAIPGTYTDARFVVRDGEELVALATRHELALHRTSGALLATQALGGLAAASVHPVAGGTAIAILGAEFSESRDTFALFGVAEIPVPASVMGRRFHFTEGLADSAHRLAVGPANSEHVAVYRDGKDEEPLTDEDTNAIVPREWGLRGFYVATLGGQTIERIPWDRPVATEASLAASERYIAFGTSDGIDVVSRRDHSHQHIDMQWLSASYTGDRLLAKMRDGSLRSVRL